MKIIDIKNITEKVKFISSEDFQTYPSSEIGCPNCGELVSINFSNLQKHALSDFSNLSSTDRKEMETFVEQSLPTNANSFLDYYCPKCNNPIRIYYNSWAGGKFESGFELKHLITG